MPEAGWYEDPERPLLRWWDGERWTAETAPLTGPSPADDGVAPPPADGPATPATSTGRIPSGDRLRLGGRIRLGGHLPVILGAVAAVIVVAVVTTLLVAGGGSGPDRSSRPTSVATAPDVTSTTQRSTVTTPATVPGAAAAFLAAVQGGGHPITGYSRHGPTLLGFGRTACAVLETRAPAVIAWYGAVTPTAHGTTAVPPIAGASLTAAAARYLCPTRTLVLRAARLATRVDTLPRALRRGGIPTSDDETAVGVAAYACDMFLTGSTTARVVASLERALDTHRYVLRSDEAGVAASVGIQAVCPAHLATWLKDAGRRRL